MLVPLPAAQPVSPTSSTESVAFHPLLYSYARSFHRLC